MAIQLISIHHIQIFVPPETDEACQRFYKNVLGLTEIEKPAQWRKNGGAWYQHGDQQLHLSRMRQPEDNHGSQRHVCYMVADLDEAELVMREAGIEIIPDDRPFDQWRRFYARDPGGNLLEVAQKYEGK
jgi:catechol 2,3-dioxygenase-like lactoylglutathione lyase family enzyme